MFVKLLNFNKLTNPEAKIFVGLHKVGNKVDTPFHGGVIKSVQCTQFGKYPFLTVGFAQYIKYQAAGFHELALARVQLQHIGFKAQVSAYQFFYLCCLRIGQAINARISIWMYSHGAVFNWFPGPDPIRQHRAASREACLY